MNRGKPITVENLFCFAFSTQSARKSLGAELGVTVVVAGAGVGLCLLHLEMVFDSAESALREFGTGCPILCRIKVV